MRKVKFQIEGDGALDVYGLRIETGNREASFVIRDIPRTAMDDVLTDLRDQFDSVTACFDDMKASINNQGSGAP